MNDYYQPSVDHGIYVACRGMEDVWNLHSLPDSYAMYDRIIEDMVLLKDADPNRVYLLGFSAGGDGVYQITPRMADRFAAANVSSGHPNDVSLLNVANVPFEIQVGVTDYYSPTAIGLSFMSFRNDEPQTEKLAFDFGAHGYTLTLTDVGCDHSAYTNEYAAVPSEMKAVAVVLGKKRLCEVKASTFLSYLGTLRAALGDRPVLRAFHYYLEMGLVDERWEALKEADIQRFLFLTRRSGASSAMFLQNVSAPDARTQDCMVALALSEWILQGRGASRIHGGGFGGSIQAFVPNELVDYYRQGMDGWLGTGSCKAYALSDEGAMAQWL